MSNNKHGEKAKPITHKEEISQHPDPRIDEDFKGFPHSPAKKEVIKPQTKEEKKTAAVDHKDGEKRIYKKGKTDEQDSDGSANAFEDK